MRARSFAKINLYLDVLPKRPDGFHDIETLFQTVDLCDELHVERAEALELTCDNPSLDCGASNLVVRAAEALRTATGYGGGARMRLEKRIPVAAGLAGGSGDAAAALVALNDLWGLGLSRAELEPIALALGSDVPYCLRGGTVAATGRGEVMTDVAPLPETWIVLVHPELHVSTRDVYESPLLTKNAEPRVEGQTASFRRALGKFHDGALAEAVFNRMEEAVFAMYPQLADIKRVLKGAGCVAVAMSGSGPTVFGVCSSEEHARGVAGQFATDRTSVVVSVGHGVQTDAT